MVKYYPPTYTNGIKGWLKTKIAHLPFLAEAFNEAYKKGGIDSFPLAQKDILETMRDDLDKQANEIADKKLEVLLSLVDEKQVLSITKTGVVYIGNEKADDGRLANLKAEADFIGASDIWKILNQSIRELAQRAMFVAGDSIDDMKKGRSMLYLLDTQNRIVTTLQSYQHKSPQNT